MTPVSPQEANDFILDYWDYEEEKYNQRKEFEKENKSRFKSKMYNSLFPVEGNIHASYKPSQKIE